ncbi:PREDICTED: uncharacterized protein LOC109175477 [Ipomoea nil]|uniref:uncharacterized protein LOC109175477 n=1 Tax=Ipomoea nil TaxID=35883 RepID=UPI000900B8F3|nr:PREDICTED: uncharacterized protein LOC109175477 [Ipomoea nil]
MGSGEKPLHLQPHLEQQPKEQRHRKPKQKPPQTLEEISKVRKKMGLPEHPSSSSPASPSSIVGSLRGMPFRKLSGCYECRMVVDPVLGLTRDPSLRTTICSCHVCVSELGVEDTSRNVVEIIFQSSWLKKHNPICTIDRILKVHNTPKVISRFEEYRDAIKAKANKLPKKHPRCVADGNELLRFQFRSGRQAARCP